MFFAATAPARHYRPALAPTDRALQRFMAEALQPSRRQAGSIAEDEKGYTLSFDIPGVAKEQLGIDIEGSIVRIETREGAPRHYKAAYELPQDIDATQSEAKLDNGVLTLKLSKLVPQSKATTLNVN